MYTHRHIRPYIGKHVQCHTHFGTFQGVIVHCTKEHLVLMPVAQTARYGMDDGAGMDDGRPWGMGGPGPGGPVGPGGGPMGPGGGGGGGWHFAIPLAAILGITAVGMHWW